MQSLLAGCWPSMCSCGVDARFWWTVLIRRLAPRDGSGLRACRREVAEGGIGLVAIAGGTEQAADKRGLHRHALNEAQHGGCRSDPRQLESGDSEERTEF